MAIKVGLQLYSIRQALKEDLSAALREVKRMGYDYVEFAGGRYGKSGEETKALLQENGLECISVHSSPALFSEDRENVFSYIKALGARYAVIPMAPGRTEAFTEHWDKTVLLFREMAQAFAEKEIELLYHNHDFEFGTVSGEVILHKLFESIPLLKPEPDLCWVSYAGVEPAALLYRYRQRVPLVHFKDYRCDALEEKPIWKLLREDPAAKKPEKRSLCGFRYLPLGEGVEDWNAAFFAAKNAGTEYIIVEQDESRDRDPIEAAAVSRRFLRECFGI